MGRERLRKKKAFSKVFPGPKETTRSEESTKDHRKDREKGVAYFVSSSQAESKEEGEVNKGEKDSEKKKSSLFKGQKESWAGEGLRRNSKAEGGA